MVIGVDFDNTIVGYDALFHQVALERGLIPKDLPVSKSEVRNYLRRIDNEDAWTEMQGYVYGPRLKDAETYPGVLEFFRKFRLLEVPVCIISHKTRYPYLGPKYDLHEAALGWLEQRGFFASPIELSRSQVFLELTKAAKLERIAHQGCSHFIDDLPEFLLEPAFPPSVKRILFDPNDHYGVDGRLFRSSSWGEITHYLSSPGEALNNRRPRE